MRTYEQSSARELCSLWMSSTYPTERTSRPAIVVYLTHGYIANTAEILFSAIAELDDMLRLQGREEALTNISLYCPL